MRLLFRGKCAVKIETALERERLTALCIEFVAKPEEVRVLPSALSAVVRDGLGQMPGFVSCLVLISNREARLVNVITLWTGAERTTCLSERAQCLHDLVMPYVDQCLRVQTLDAYLSALCSVSGGTVERESVARVVGGSEQVLPLCLA